MCNSRSVRALFAFMLALTGSAQAADRFGDIGRTATPTEIAAWDIDVRPDFKGLPPGRGSVAEGQLLWEAKCAGCHGVFGESNETFMPLVGGTTKDDIARGRVARLNDAAFPLRTTMMKLSSLATLWDYIRRAMPWNAPKSLSNDEVYAVSAYLLNLAEVLPADGELSDRNIREVEQRLPNRNGLRADIHAMWPGPEFKGRGKPDVQGSRCMRDCTGDTRVASALPDYARNQHGDLAQQQRLVGAQLGASTAPATAVAGASAPAASPVTALLQQHACIACHQVDRAVVGPAFRDVARKYAQRGDAVSVLAGKIKSGGVGAWGSIPMPAQAALADDDARAIATWLAAGAPP